MYWIPTSTSSFLVTHVTDLAGREAEARSHVTRYDLLQVSDRSSHRHDITRIAVSFGQKGIVRTAYVRGINTCNVLVPYEDEEEEEDQEHNTGIRWSQSFVQCIYSEIIHLPRKPKKSRLLIDVSPDDCHDLPPFAASLILVYHFSCFYFSCLASHASFLHQNIVFIVFIAAFKNHSGFLALTTFGLISTIKRLLFFISYRTPP